MSSLTRWYLRAVNKCEAKLGDTDVLNKTHGPGRLRSLTATISVYCSQKFLVWINGCSVFEQIVIVHCSFLKKFLSWFLGICTVSSPRAPEVAGACNDPFRDCSHAQANDCLKLSGLQHPVLDFTSHRMPKLLFDSTECNSNNIQDWMMPNTLDHVSAATASQIPKSTHPSQVRNIFIVILPEVAAVQQLSSMWVPSIAL